MQLPVCNDIKVYMTNIFFIFLIESTWDPDMKIIKNFLISNFLHRVLAVQKREILLPVGSQTAQSGDLGIVEP